MRYRVVKNTRCDDVWYHIEKYWPLFGWKEMIFDFHSNRFDNVDDPKKIICEWTSPDVFEVVHEKEEVSE